MAEDRPQLSIIVPVYGVEKYLAKCLDSILAQSFRDFELILVDDGGRDGCPALCDAYAARFPVGGRPSVRVRHKENAGYGAAMNTGLDMAEGTWIGLVEPDDWIRPDMYDKLMSRTRDAGVDIVKCDFEEEIGKRVAPYGWTPPPPEDRAFSTVEYPFFLRRHPSIWTCVYRKSFLDEKGIRFQELPGAGWADNLFQVQTLCLARSLAFVATIGYHYLVHDLSRPVSDPRIPFERSLEIDAWLREKHIGDPRILSSLYCREVAYCGIAARTTPLRRHRLFLPLLARCLRDMDAVILASPETPASIRRACRALRAWPRTVCALARMQAWLFRRF